MKKTISLKKYFLILITFLLVCAGGFSQPNSAFGDVCKNISSHKVTKGDFNQIKMIKKLKREIKSSGVFIVSVDDGILWNTQKPFKSSMAITKSKIIQTNAAGKKTIVSSGDNGSFEQFSSLISALFEGNTDLLNKNFEIEFIGSVDNWNVNLVPKDSTVRAVIGSIEMAGRASIDTLIMNEPSGDFTKYELFNQTFSDSLTGDEKAAFSE